MRTLAAALFGLLLAAPAVAGHPGYGPRAQVVVHVDPWSPAYRPAPQAGMVWVDGYWDDFGAWVPGYWQPTYARAGYTWVPGYWDGVSYVGGFWRPVARPGYSWVGGYYSGRSWVGGYWAPQAQVVYATRPAPRPVVVHRASAPRHVPVRGGSSRPSSGARPAARVR